MTEAKLALRAGAGGAAIKYPPEMFPTQEREKYTGVHDDPYINVILIEYGGKRYSILVAELVSLSMENKIRDKFEEMFAGAYGVPVENQLIHIPHVLTAPHNWFEIKTAEDFYRNNLMCIATIEAAREAGEKALESLRDARFGYGLGKTNFNVNRVIETDKGWWQGTNDDGDTDNSLPVFRFDDLDGNTIAIQFIVNCAAGMLENSVNSDGSRLVSADIAGASRKFVEKEFPGAVAMYCAGATGDQWQAIRARFGTMGRGGKYTEVDLHEQGFFLLELMGARLGQQVVRTADRIVCSDVETVRLVKRVFTFPGQKQLIWGDSGPRKGVKREPDEDRQSKVTLFQLDNTVLIGVTPEMQAKTARHMIENSPFRNTAFMSWVIGEYPTGGYMVERDMYEKETYQSMRTHFAAGSAELMCDDVVKFLNDLWMLDH